MRLLLLASLLALACAEYATIASRTPHRYSKWVVEREAYPEELVSFKVLLKQQNLDKLDSIFWEVSDPTSPNYGKFLTEQDVARLVAPQQSTVQRVVNWLIAGGLKREAFTFFPDYIQVATDVSSASNLFSVDFALYRSTKSGNTRIRINGFAQVPEVLLNDIDFVVGLSELIDSDARHAPKYSSCADSEFGADVTDNFITPAILKQYYGIPTGLAGTNAASQGIAAFSDYFSFGALENFDSYFNITGINVTRIGPDCFNETCDQYESDLDIQYISSIALGIPTTFLAHPDGAWILDWAQQIATMTNPPLVNSISYGWPELEQCEITSDCSTLGYNSVQYVTRTDDELKKLGTLGLTVLVSSGDDGAPSFYGSSGNCPIDPTTYCPLGGCNHTSTDCVEISVYFAANSSTCELPMGLGTTACMAMTQDQNFDAALSTWAQANANCDIAFENDREGNPHLYSACQCSQMTYGTYSGYQISAYTYNQANGPIFTAEYPTSSPYVTSVSATQFLWNGNTVQSEVTASIQTGAKITTGGGFSTFQPQPSYQASAVSSYFKSGVTLPPSYGYNTSNRAYPDISFNGHNFVIAASNNTQNMDACPCFMLPVDGTSASSPSLAGLLSLINSQLIGMGKSPIGFANPALYQMFASDPSAFNDITQGSNRCNRAYCCEYGWSATQGWDPATGLGSPNFPNMVKYFLNAKGVAQN
eukprot:Phypoly_transcript_03440.p1 GENE.Phypoly_transcript_03440~~Phypoly_transcript_03440.p1  ORF type:complete len:705 (+),score=87.98 Phypoly_transcript_03440:71-2185(+)